MMVPIYSLQVVVESMDRDEIQENFMENLIAHGTLDDRDDDVIPDDGGDDVTATYLNESGEGAEDIEEEDPSGAGEEQEQQEHSAPVWTVDEAAGASWTKASDAADGAQASIWGTPEQALDWSATQHRDQDSHGSHDDLRHS